MLRTPGKVPSYCHHKASGRVVVCVPPPRATAACWPNSVGFTSKERRPRRSGGTWAVGVVGCGADSPDWCRDKEESATSSCATYGPAVPREWRSHRAINGPPRPTVTPTRPPAEPLRNGHGPSRQKNRAQAVPLYVRSTGPPPIQELVHYHLLHETFAHLRPSVFRNALLDWYYG